MSKKEDEVNEVEMSRRDQKPFPEVVLQDEPAEEDPDKVEIAFRLPHGEKAVRRFKKGYKVQEMYNYIDTLQKEGKFTFENQEEGEYEDEYQILQSFPRKVYDDREMTIEETGLWPRGGVVIVQHTPKESDEE